MATENVPCPVCEATVPALLTDAPHDWVDSDGTRRKTRPIKRVNPHPYGLTGGIRCDGTGAIFTDPATGG